MVLPNVFAYINNAPSTTELDKSVMNPIVQISVRCHMSSSLRILQLNVNHRQRGLPFHPYRHTPTYLQELLLINA